MISARIRVVARYLTRKGVFKRLGITNQDLTFKARSAEVRKVVVYDLELPMLEEPE
jgi:hypothetical protein